MKNKKIQIARNIEFIRSLKGFSQAELGEALGGISKQAVSKMLQKGQISEDRLIKIAHLLGVTPEDLMVFDQKTIISGQTQRLGTIEAVFDFFERCIGEKRAKVEEKLKLMKENHELYTIK